MDTVYLHWDFKNMITVCLMAAVGFAILTWFAQLYKNRSNS